MPEDLPEYAREILRRYGADESILRPGGEPSPPDPGRRRSRSTIAAVAVLVVLGAALVAYVPVGRAYADKHVFTAEEKAPLAFVASPGDRVAVRVKTHGAVAGLWASATGVRLVLPGRAPAPLVKPSGRDWGDDISASNRATFEDITVGGVFTVPAGASGTLRGALQGTITYPARVGFSGSFRDQTDTLANPVTITVVPRSHRSVWATGLALEVMIWVCLGLCAVLIGCVLNLGVQTVRERGLPGVTTLLACLVAMALGGFLVLLGAYELQDVSGLFTAPAPLVTPWALPAGLVAAVTLGILVVLVRINTDARGVRAGDER